MYIHIRFSQHGFVTLIPNVKRSIMLLEKVTPAGSETLGADACSLTSCNTHVPMHPADTVQRRWDVPCMHQHLQVLLLL